MQRYLPFLNWLSHYKKKYIAPDLLAGLTIGIVLIPQGMAYAMIAGMPPVYGLYAGIIPILVYALLGTSRQLAIGPVAMDSLLVAAGLGALSVNSIEDYVALAIMLTFLVGGIQVLLGLLRMGFLVNFLSKPVISGFTSAAAIIIAFSQLKHLLGTPIAQSNQFYTLFADSIRAFADLHLLSFGLGLGGILLILLLKKWSDRIPGILILVVIGIAGSYFLKLEEHGLSLVGAIPGGLPFLEAPDFNWEHIKTLLPMALTLAVIGYTEVISIGQTIEEKNKEDSIKPNQELIALGMANALGSFFQSYSVAASFSRSAINNRMNARTPVASIFSVLLVILVLLFLTPVFYYLPKAVLASIIMVSVAGLVEIKYPTYLWKQQRDEFYVLAVTFLMTLFLGILQGILFGVLISLLLLLYRTSKPHFAVLGKIRGTEYYRNVERFTEEAEVRDDLLIVRFDSQLYFGNKSFFKNQLNRFIDERGSALKCVILNAEAINYIDSTAASMLVQLIADLHGKGIGFYVSGAIGPARDVIFNSGIITHLPKEHLFLRIQEAVDFYDHPGSATEIQERIAYQRQNSANS